MNLPQHLCLLPLWPSAQREEPGQQKRERYVLMVLMQDWRHTHTHILELQSRHGAVQETWYHGAKITNQLVLDYKVLSVDVGTSHTFSSQKIWCGHKRWVSHLQLPFCEVDLSSFGFKTSSLCSITHLWVVSVIISLWYLESNQFSPKSKRKYVWKCEKFPSRQVWDTVHEKGWTRWKASEWPKQDMKNRKHV